MAKKMFDFTKVISKVVAGKEIFPDDMATLTPKEIKAVKYLNECNLYLQSEGYNQELLGKVELKLLCQPDDFRRGFMAAIGHKLMKREKITGFF